MSGEKLVPLEKFVDKYIANAKKKQQATSDYTLNKLHELISDGVTTSESDTWISRLLQNFLRNLGDDGYKVQDLPIAMEVLEFLAWKARDKKEYEIHLDKMLELCKLPPLLQNTSESLGCTAVLERYFSMLGYLIAVLPNDKDILKVFRAIDCLLVRSVEEANKSAVKADLCLLAMEKSRLPVIIAELVEISSWTMYRRLLELVFLLAANSYTCCYRMLEARILDHLLIRMDSHDGYRDKDESLLKNEETVSRKECTIVSVNIAWTLVRSILSPSKLPTDLRNSPEPNDKATRSLRNVLRRQVLESNQGNRKNIMLRNDVAVLILAGMVALPSWHLVKSGLAEDLIVLSIATESGTSGTWAEGVKFRTNNEDDLYFKKIMLSIVCQLCNRNGDAVVAIMVERRAMTGILELIKPATVKSCYFSQYAMRILARLVPKMPQEFTLHKGLMPTLAQLSSFAVEFDSHIVLEITKTICNIINTVKISSLVLESIYEAGIVASLIDLVNRILAFDRLTMQHQRILTLLIITVEKIEKTKKRRPVERCGDDRSCVNMLTKLLKRSLYQRRSDFQFDSRLLIAIGSYIWLCIVNRPENIQEFVNNGGIYVVLDVIEHHVTFPVCCIYLGILTDMCFAGYGVSQLSTWRGVNKTKGLVSLLAKSWREEEIRIGVKRTPEGFIDDTELPIMGTEQWINAFHARATYNLSPVLASMLGSLRPKIYGLRKIIITHEADRYEKSKEHYKILLNNTQTEERITMYIADQLYRFSQGQAWSEVSRYLEQRGVNLLGMDGEIIILMNDRHCAWATYVRGLQDTLLGAKRKKERERERKEIMRIRNSKLGSSLNSLEKIDYIRRTTDHNYIIEKKKLQRAQIKDASRFPGFYISPLRC